MARADDREVTLVESRHLRLVEALAEGDHGRVDEAQVERLVLAFELGRALEIVDRQRLEAVGA